MIDMNTFGVLKIVQKDKVSLFRKVFKQNKALIYDFDANKLLFRSKNEEIAHFIALRQYQFAYYGIAGVLFIEGIRCFHQEVDVG